MLENGGEPLTIDMIDQNKYLNKIMSWLEECEITYTQTAKPWNWKLMMADIRGDNRFYLDTYDDGERKPAGWWVPSDSGRKGLGSLGLGLDVIQHLNVTMQYAIWDTAVHNSKIILMCLKCFHFLCILKKKSEDYPTIVKIVLFM